MIDLCYPPVDEEHGKGETPETKLGEETEMESTDKSNGLSATCFTKGGIQNTKIS